MPSTVKNEYEVPTKTPRAVVSFRVSEKIKDLMASIAVKQNLDPSAIHRNAYNAGLAQLYGLKIVGNELVEIPPEFEIQVSP